jgi:hypothetical protein
MARAAIVSNDIQTIFGKAGEAGAFTTRWANLLRQSGEEVAVVMVRTDREPMRVDPDSRARLRSDRIPLIELQAPPADASRWPEVPTMRLAEIAAPVLKGFDIVYFQDRGNAAFHLVRTRRYGREHGPVAVTVLHGPSEWQLSTRGRYPDLPDDLHLFWQERYAARHGDFVVSPSRTMVEHVRRLGWAFPGEARVLGLPMPDGADRAPNSLPARIRRIVCFAPIEERQGIRTFVSALRQFSAQAGHKPEIVLLGPAEDRPLFRFALRNLRSAGFNVSAHDDLETDAMVRFLREKPHETLCVIPSPFTGHPYAVIEASLISGLNLIVCRGDGVPEALEGAEEQLCDSSPADLALRIAERVNRPLGPAELARYDCAAANARWLNFHREALESARNRPPRSLPVPKPSVDVCVTYYQKAAYLGQLVDALEQQTETDFHVIAVNDGSPDDESNRVFEQKAKRAAARDWDFYRQENAFVDAARNSAARRGSGDLILFIDADDVPARNAVARMREAIALSGDDALICASYLFAGDKRPFDPETGNVEAAAFATCIPLGMDLAGGLLNPLVFGGSMFVIRRSVFEKIGGFREIRGAGHEEWELYVRLALAGCKVDVLPELLQFYRQVEDGLARQLPDEASKKRLLSVYEDALKPLGLEGAAMGLAGLYQSSLRTEEEVRQLSKKAAAPLGRYGFFSGRTNVFESNPDVIDRLRLVYRKLVPLDVRLEFHRRYLAPFFGPYEPPNT